MPNITKQQAIIRWDRLPMILREAIFSERNADILWGVCETQHLSEDKIRKIAAIAGDILMGFLHPEDLAKEIKNEVNINQEIADIIAKEAERKIFSPIKSEIDKAYMLPLTEEEEAEEAEGEEAEEPVITDIRREGIKIIREAKYSKLGGVVGEAEPLKIIATEGIEKVVIPEAVKEEMKEAAAALSVPEGPAVLYQEKEVAPALGDASKKSLGDLFGFLNGKETIVKKEASQVVAGVEMGDLQSTTNNLQPTTIKEKQEEPKERLVHYSELKTPLSPLGEPIEKPAAVEEQKPAVEAAEPKKAIRPFELIKSVFKEIKPTVKVVDFIQQTQTDADLIQTSTNKIIQTDMDNKIDEASKTIAEEIKEEPVSEAIISEEIPKEEIPKKESFFGKLFRFRKEKKEQIAAEEAPVEIPVAEEIKVKEEAKDKSLKVSDSKSLKISEFQSLKEKPESLKEEIMKKEGFFKKLFGFKRNGKENESLKASEFQNLKEEKNLENKENFEDSEFKNAKGEIVEDESIKVKSIKA